MPEHSPPLLTDIKVKDLSPSEHKDTTCDKYLFIYTISETKKLN